MEVHIWVLQRQVRLRDSDVQGQVPRQRRENATASCISRERSPSEAEKNEIWNAIKTIPDWQKDSRRRYPGDRPRAGGRGHAARAAAQDRTPCKAGDTLSKIAKEHLGNAGAYMKIFDANKDLLSDPDKIKPGQVLRIP